MNDIHTVNIGKQFSRFPIGRHRDKGPSSGEQFRDDIIAPLLDLNDSIINIELDDAIGFGSSFLEEAFGGLVRKGWSQDQLSKRLNFISEDLSLIDEIWTYIKDAKNGKR